MSFRDYTAADGLASLGGACLLQDRAGFILSCSDRGLFAYNGRRFLNLGPAQGLTDGGSIYDLVQTADGRIAVRYVDRLMISDPETPGQGSPTDLRFRPVALPPGISFYTEVGDQMVPWKGGLAVIAGHRTMRLAPGGNPTLALEPAGFDESESAALGRPHRLFALSGKLWETLDDGRICSAEPGSVRCFGAGQGLRQTEWLSLIDGPDATVLARSADMFATLSLSKGTAEETPLPDQGAQYGSFLSALRLFRLPGGDLATQAASGLLVRKAEGWTELTVEDGVPAGIIVREIVDRGQQMWMQVDGRGLHRSIGYPRWSSVQHADGLSAGTAWQVARSSDNSLYISTDTGLTQLRQVGGRPRVTRILDGNAYRLAIGPGGRIWSSIGRSGVRIIDPYDGSVTTVSSPPVDSIVVGRGGRVWLGTEAGLFRVETAGPGPLVAVLDGTDTEPAVTAITDHAGGVWFFRHGRLWHRPAGAAAAILVEGPWPAGGFEPMTAALAPDASMWIAGPGGLYHFKLSGNRVVSFEPVPASDLPSSAVLAVMVDHRGWLWVGTGRGLAIFDGRRWVSVDETEGLVWNDVSQGGLYEDADGSIWIATSDGVSHLRDPEFLFSDRPISVAISQATLGATTLPAAKLPYTNGPLALQFGTFSYAAERSIVFRYQMSGVDDGWVETESGSVRYPFVPPGKHLLTVIGYDTLSHAVSAPATLSIDIAFPWWRRWWAYTAYALAAAALAYAMVKWRERAARIREHRLEILVEERTREMRIAQAELRRQAMFDGLTGLLNRSEVQNRLAASLASAGAVDPHLLVALIDIDHFKRINDQYGHLAGDAVLRAIGDRLRATLRDGEYAGRYGGEEMLIILDSSDGDARARFIGLNQSIRQTPICLSAAPIFVTCSIGVATACENDDWESLIGRADEALYAAKTSGRDKIVERKPDQLSRRPAWPDTLRRVGGSD